MARSSMRCDFHPDREAVEKCERCGRLICLECKTIFHTSGTMNRDGRSYIFCPVCYDEQQEATARVRATFRPTFRPFMGRLSIVFCIISVVMIIAFLAIVMSLLGSFGNLGGFP